MKVLIKNELRLSKKILLIWMAFVLLLCGFAYIEYLSLQDSLGELVAMMDTFPKILMIMFGIGEDLTSALGWYGCMYFWVAILAYSYAVYLGVTCITKEKEQGTAEYLFTKPVSRSQIVISKVIACVLNLFVLAVFSGLCNYFTAIQPLGGLEQKWTAVTTTMGLFFTEVVLFVCAVLVSSLVKSYKNAVRLCAGLLLLFYGIYIIADYLDLSVLYYLTPLKYFDVYTVAKEGFSIVFLLMAAVIILFSITVAKKVWASREV